MDTITGKLNQLALRSKQNNQLVWKIIQIFKNSKKNYGSPRIYKELRRQDISISLNKVARLMHRNNIYTHYSAKHKKAKIARNTSGFAFNILNREFKTAKANKKWVSDTTFIWTKQGWLYLAAIVDLYSSKVVGWSMSANNDTKLVSQALKMANNRKPKQQEVLLHSNQGSQYRANNYLTLFKKYNIKQSMSRKGECHDNAVIESFFSTLKRELISMQSYETRQKAKTDVFEYIETFYNKTRLHSYLNYQSPVEFEKKCL